MKPKKPFRIFLWALLFTGLCVGAFLLYDRGRPVPVPMKQTLYEGVTYRRMVKISPRPMIVHIIVIDTRVEGVRFLVTPPDLKGDTPLNARTTSQFLKEFGVQIAINGDGFSPWWSRSPVDYYPRPGDPVAPWGFSASGGDVYSQGVLERVGEAPTLYISRRNDLSFNRRPGSVFHAISGDRMLLEKGEIVEGLDNSALEPRSALGTNRNGRILYLIVVDGRQPFYSEGVTFMELAQLLKDQGAHFAMALDGGGSSTLVVEGEDGEPVILNSPIDNYIPGRERPVGNHLGIFIK